MVKVLPISPLKSLEKSSHPNLTYLEGKGKQKEEEKFVCTCNERKGKGTRKGARKGWLVQVVWWMNEWMNECHPDKKKINGAKALSFIRFNMLLICSMIVTKPKQTIFVCVCVCVKWKKRNYDDLGLLSWSLLVSIPFCIAPRYSVPPPWVILSFFYPEFLRVPCQGKSEHLLLFIPRKDTKWHATHCSLPWTTLFISTLLLICTHEWGGGGEGGV